MDIRNFFGHGFSTKKSTSSDDASGKETKTKNQVKKTPLKLDKNGNNNIPDKKPEKRDKSKEHANEKETSKSRCMSGGNSASKGVKEESIPKQEKEEAIPGSASKKRKKTVISDEDPDAFEKTPSKPREKKHKRIQRIVESDSDEDPLPPTPKPEAKSRKQKKKVLMVVGSDSDEDPLPPTPKSASRSRKRKKKEPMFVDSDEEKMKSPIKAFFKPTPQKAAETKPKQPTSASKLKSVSVADFFGGGAIQRTERKVTPSKMKSTEEVKGKHTDDVEIHDDEDFEKTLMQLDDNTAQKKEQNVSTSFKSPKKQKSTDSGTNSLSNKLASKVRTEKNLASETPDKSKKSSTPSKHDVTCVPETPITKKPSPVKNSINTPAKISPTSKKSPEKIESSPTEGTPSLDKKTSYRSYLHREGPRALGSKEIPQGADNCLEGLTFVITGVLDSMERDESKSLIEKYGGKVTTSLSKKTSYLVLGRDAGESKMQKAKQFGTKQIDEDELLNLVRTKPGKVSKYEIQAKESIKKENSMKSKADVKTDSFGRKQNFTKLQEFNLEKDTSKKLSPETAANDRLKSPLGPTQSGEVLLWVDKHKPTALKQIIGQQGDKSNAKKLLHWLSHWHASRATGKKPTGRFYGNDDGSGFKAALLSGPPGVGKTTTAQLVCQENGFSYVELNASDTRSKKTLQAEVAESLNNQTLVDYMGYGHSCDKGQKHCLIMDEIDGMSGNQDRGGLQEVILLIKQSKIPIICMCNDRNHPKMRSLANHCYDLRFYKPRVEQIKAAMMSLAYKEGIKIPPPALNEIILAANQDIRQVIHNLSMWSIKDKAITYEQAKQDASKAKKDLKLGPFDVCRKVFVGGEETAGMTINDKSDLFFHDYSFSPLFVQENYPHAIPYAAKGDMSRHLSLLAHTAISISEGDLVDRLVRGQQRWDMLPLQAIFASVIPGERMRGSFSQMVNFPSWLGKNSSRNKTDRILQELGMHMRLKISADKKGLNMEYLPFLRTALSQPLVKKETDGVREVIDMMDEYDIIKEDFDNIMEITKWPNSKDPMSQLSTKTKSAFTRSYNKEVHMTPYATGTVAKKRRGGASAVEEGEEMEGDEGVGNVESDEDEDNIERDTMIKQAKKKQAGRSKTEIKIPETSRKGKGRGKGRSKGKS